ncbi:MAG: tRNA (adenosine(37)-N6)-threonylcarbamoyltransferase complex ATPase subunit type 1 TsaE [Patescibacteria group bacterium]|jgi:tRNA threonylcarbamoyladenosine biosynthesis protein TsaE
MANYTLEDTKKLAERVAEKLIPGDVIALSGDLGSGKTTFVKFLVEALGFDSKVQSPTFVICRKYVGGKGPIKVINHIDLYRIQNKVELEGLGVSELLTERDAISVIEWPDLIEDKLPQGTMKITFEYIDEEKRRVNARDLYRFDRKI